jgi:hypothetical protein
MQPQVVRTRWVALIIIILGSLPLEAGARESGIVRMAGEFTAPVPILNQGIHPGSRPAAASVLSVGAPNVVVSAVKKGEEGDDLIVRCYEPEGRATRATIVLGLVNRRWTGTFRPLENQDAPRARHGRGDPGSQLARAVNPR